ncbi:MAG: metalloregulator ArsR/SmtB family transcription factor [Gemmatimonadota bacterium]|nr:metalloregulator ArsR/SmtB family transcription factor [Gemmatimonadota bacterium]
MQKNKESNRAVKDSLFEEFARIGKAVSSPHRIEILDLLSQGEKSVEVLASATALTVKNASAQLKVLREARLVESRRDGQRVFYGLANNEVSSFWLAMRRLGELQYAEVRDIAERYFRDPDGKKSIERNRLIEKCKRGEVVVVDVRPEEEYISGHIPGSLSIPIDELVSRLPSLPKQKEIVAYCRGPYCVYANEALSVLRENGFEATKFEEDVSQWREAGLPVEEGPETDGTQCEEQKK